VTWDTIGDTALLRSHIHACLTALSRNRVTSRFIFQSQAVQSGAATGGGADFRLLTPEFSEKLTSEKAGQALEIFFNAQQLIIFAHAIRAASRSRFNLAGIGSNRQIRNERVLGLA
jgi:hypothetical protein